MSTILDIDVEIVKELLVGTVSRLAGRVSQVLEHSTTSHASTGESARHASFPNGREASQTAYTQADEMGMAEQDSGWTERVLDLLLRTQMSAR